MTTVSQCSPTGNDLPFSVWTLRLNPCTGQPMRSEAAAVFAYLLEALDYIAYLGRRKVDSVLRGMYGHVTEYPADKAALLASERQIESDVLAGVQKVGAA